MKNWIREHRHGWVFLYVLIYMPWFFYLEHKVTQDFHVIHSPIDDWIPFVEYFIIPYTLWFGYIAVTILYFFFKDKTKKEFYQLVIFLFTGMTLFLLICTIYPNGLMLRPEVFPRDNFCTQMVKGLYLADTPTNVLPSIHVFNSIGAYIAIARNERLKKRPVIHYGALILSILIVLSTMFLKQHSIIDVLSAFLLASVMYFFVYALPDKKEREKIEESSAQEVL